MIRKHETERAVEQWLCRGAQGCAAVAAGLAALAWLSWGFDRWPLFTFGTEYVPMAPGTALLLLLLLLSTAVFLRGRWPSKLATNVFGLVAASVVALLSSLVLAQHAFGLALPAERWLAPTDNTVGGISVGRMSPLTAATFLAAAAALLLQLPPLDRRRLSRRAGAAAATVVSLVGVVIILGCVSDTPLLYGEETIPMALLTAASFALLGLGLLLGGGAAARLLVLLAGGAPPAGEKEYRRSRLAVAAPFLVLATGIAAVGFFYLRHQQANARQAAKDELAAIADLKVAQIVNWRKERLADAKTMLKLSALADDFQQLLANPADAWAKKAVLSSMAAWQEKMPHQRIVLLDPSQHVRLVLPAGKNWSEATVIPLLTLALRTSEVFVSDLHFSDLEPGHLDLDIVVPLLPAPGAAASARQPVGVLVFEIDPRDFLYPLIQSWPTPSRSAETLLVRRDGDDVLFLNELRHQTGTTLKLRMPLSRPLLPAALAVLGSTEPVEGFDYRNVAVLAALRSVPDSPWFLVAKVDQAEVYAPLRRQALVTGLLVGVLFLATMLGAGLLERQRSVELLRQDLAHERERQGLAERIVYLTKHANDIILLADEDWRILEANDRALEAYGYALDELRRMTVRDLRSPEARAEFDRQASRMEAVSGAVLETVHQRKDGSTFPVENSVRAIELAGVTYHQCILRDITERKRSGDELLALLDETERARVALLSILEDERQAEEQLRAEHERLRALASQLSAAEERERRRLAATLHEQIGQLLALSKLKLAALRKDTGDPELARQVDEVKAMVDETLAATRSLTSELAPPILYRVGLAAATEWYGERLKEQTGFAVQCTERGTPGLLGDDMRGFLFAAARELLHNVVKHAHTNSARVLLDWQGEVIVLTVEDDGAGFEPEAGCDASDGRGCFGLFSIRERASDLGGRLEVDSAPGKGTRVRLVMPAAPPGLNGRAI